MRTSKIMVVGLDRTKESATALGFDTVIDPTNNGTVFKKLNKNVVVRWGCSWRLYDADNGIDRDFDRVINSAAAIRRNCNKPRSLHLMEQVVNTPKVYSYGWDVGGVRKDIKIPKGEHVVVRDKEHQGGNGFQVKRGPFILPREQHATLFVETKQEYRVWFCGNKTICAERTSRYPHVLKRRFPCRSLWNYIFHSSTPQKLHDDTLKAAAAIGLDFGAADILYKDGKYYFLELNSAPTCDREQLVEFYKNGILEIAKTKKGDKNECRKI